MGQHEDFAEGARLALPGQFGSRQPDCPGNLAPFLQAQRRVVGPQPARVRVALGRAREVARAEKAEAKARATAKAALAKQQRARIWAMQRP
jgi:hypothetical protein